ncbi:MAG: hypothetical protein Q9169_008373 [Polycauliona sp. 2 TL-2023]
MLSQLLFVASIAVTPVLSCADHTQRGHLSPRASDSSTEWAYDASYDWGALSPDFITCQTGTQQAPIALSLTDGPSPYHHPSFQGYDRTVTGNWTNWSYGPAFNIEYPNNDISSLPAIKWNNETAYLIGWHIHAPADHPVDGGRSRAELHLVHVNQEGSPAAVLAIRLDPGTVPLPFISQVPKMVPFTVTSGGRSSKDLQFLPEQSVKPEVVPDVAMNMDLALGAVDHFSEFWTYKGGLTSPPCTEGIRFFVATTIALTSAEQMQDILGVCRFSARMEQNVWLHDVNGA